MKPIDFAEKTKTLGKPSNMTDEECIPLPVWNGDEKTCISCWKASFKQRVKFLFTGKMWVGIYSGQTQPPVWITPDHPFTKTGEDDGD